MPFFLCHAQWAGLGEALSLSNSVTHLEPFSSQSLYQGVASTRFPGLAYENFSNFKMFYSVKISKSKKHPAPLEC